MSKLIPAPSRLRASTPVREPLRLRMTDHPGGNQLDGGWWPQSRDLTVELPDLADHFPAKFGQIVRVLYSPPDWTPPIPRRVPVGRSYVKADSYPRDGAHLMQLDLSNGRVVRVLVVPPHYSDGEGGEALLAATTHGYPHTASALLETVRDSPDADPADQWNDDGGNWWGAHRIGPSFRTRN
ncbi:MAG: DUF5994 family protein [Actinomycetia bacterium]|nr:DUF5994 family protein [Actinomycetes bacterium]